MKYGFMQVALRPKSPLKVGRSRLVQQSPYWAKVKTRQGWKAMAFDTDIRPAAVSYRLSQGPNDLLILCRETGPDSFIAYVPYGPRLEPAEEDQGVFLESLSETLREFLPPECLCIRYDLPWESPWARDENRYNDRGNWMGPPDDHVREMRMNFNTQHGKLRKAPGNNLPSHTLFLDLKKNREEILQNMKPKTRYNIRLAGRRGIRVRNAGPEDLPVWQDLYMQTAARNGITPHPVHFFETALQAKDEGTRVIFLLAHDSQEYVAGLFLVLSAGRATYLYGASSSSRRNKMGTYALQWKAIELAQNAGCGEYDLFGVSPVASPSHPLYGLYRFKKGFGGSLFHRQGCWDYPLDEEKYLTYRAMDIHCPGFHRS